MNNSKDFLTKDFFVKNYVGDTTINDLCKISGFTHDTVKKALLSHGLEYRKPKYRVKPQILERSVVHKLHIDDKLPINVIARTLGVTVAVVKRSLKHHQIDARRYTKAETLGIDPCQIKDLHNGKRIPLSEIAKMYGVSDVFIGDICRSNNIHIHNFAPRSTSTQEQEILEFVRQYFPNADKIKIGRKELDIVVPEKNLAIEYCGVYWHSDAIAANRMAHFNKMNLAKQYGYNLLTIFSDEYRDRKDVVQSIIRSKIGMIENRVFARNCQIVEVDSKQANDFYDKNHIQGRTRSQLLNAALVNNDKIVAVMSFGFHPRNNSIALTRYATETMTTVVGGPSKLFKYAIDKIETDAIISWSDNRWSNGGLYQKLGFEKHTVINPLYFYVKNGNRFPMQRFTKKRIGCPPDVKEHVWMKSQGYHRIWDCGKIGWLYRK